MTCIVKDFDVGDPADVERLAALFNAMDSAWPGGFTRGLVETPDRVRDRMRQASRLAVLVAEQDGEFVGYCDLKGWSGMPDLVYVDLLGARLSHHGQGVGKALLREMIRRATALGCRQITLHTWGGNTKAVPLYKKTGFQWVPETDVFMRNFIPGILNSPVGRAFFRNRDWYACHQREIVVAPDEVTWRGMKVYPYRFRDGDAFLNMTFDLASSGLTALETPEFSVACSIQAEEAGAGETVPIAWEIRAHGGRELDVVLLTEAEPGLEIGLQERLRVCGESTITRDLRISADATPRRQGEDAHRVRSTLLIDGQPVSLETGVKVVRPLEIQYEGQALVVGRDERITVRLRNRLDRPLEGRLSLDAVERLACAEPCRPFAVPARSWTQCEYAVRAESAGAHATRLRFDANDSRGGRSVTFRAFAGGEVIGSVDAIDDEMATLETPSLRLRAFLRGGGLQLTTRPVDRAVMWHGMGEIGPPYSHWSLRPACHTARIEERDGQAALVLVAPSSEMPGVEVERTLRVVDGGLVRVDYLVRNTTERARPLKLKVNGNNELHAVVTFATPQGIVHEPSRGQGIYPQEGIDALAHGGTFAESWAACEEDGLVAGLIWSPGAEEEMGWHNQPALTFDLGEVPAHGACSVPAYYLYAGPGNWQTVRGWWGRLVRPSETHEKEEAEPVRVLEVRTTPAPVLLTSDCDAASVEVHNRRGLALNGELTLAGEAVQVEPARLTLDGVNRDRSFSAQARFTPDADTPAGFVDAEVHANCGIDRFRLPFVRVASDGDVQVREAGEGVLVVENGVLAFRVAPAFGGAITSLIRGGIEHLLSAWPERKPFVWANPWIGGIHPFLGWMGDRRLPAEAFTGKPIERTGETGLEWKGVRVAADLSHKDLRWLHVEVDYLALPGSPLLAAVTRWRNRTDARMDTPGNVGLAVWCRAGGDRETAILHWERDGERRVRTRGGFGMEVRSGMWGAVENGRTGEALVVSAGAPAGYAYAEDFGEEGPHLSACRSLTLEPGETREFLAWVVLRDAPSPLEAWGALGRLRQLP